MNNGPLKVPISDAGSPVLVPYDLPSELKQPGSTPWVKDGSILEIIAEDD